MARPAIPSTPRRPTHRATTTFGWTPAATPLTTPAPDTPSERAREKASGFHPGLPPGHRGPRRRPVRVIPARVFVLLHPPAYDAGRSRLHLHPRHLRVGRRRPGADPHLRGVPHDRAGPVGRRVDR